MLKKAQGAIVSTTVGVYSLASNQAKRRLLRVSSSISAKVISYESLISHDHEAAVAVIESLQEINIYQRLIVPLRMERVRVFNLESDELLFPRKTTGMRVFHMTAEGSDISKFINLFQVNVICRVMCIITVNRAYTMNNPAWFAIITSSRSRVTIAWESATTFLSVMHSFRPLE